jgi:outer membrane protein assembly factor BamB
MPHAATPVAGESWRQYGHDATHCAGTPVVVASSPQVVWTRPVSGTTVGPVVDGAGRVLVGGASGIVALDASGQEVASLPAASFTTMTDIAVLSDDTVVAASHDGKLYRFAHDLTPMWTLPLEPTIEDSLDRLTVGAGDVVYVPVVTSTTTSLAAVSPGGQLLWRVKLADGGRNAAAAQAADGYVYVEAEAWNIYGQAARPSWITKLGTDGTVVWQTSIAGGTSYAGYVPCAAPDGVRIEVTTLIELPPPNVMLVGTDGKVAWGATNPGGVPAPPIPGPGGSTFVGTPSGIFAFDHAGAPGWTVPAAAPPLNDRQFFGELVRSGDGTLLAADASSALYGVCDGAIAWSTPVGPSPGAANTTPVAIASDGTVYLLYDWTVYALR